MPRVRMLIHPTCAASYEAVKRLHEEGLLDRVELASTAAPGEAMRLAAWSVPWVLVDGEPAATDPVDPVEVVEIATGTWARRVEDPVAAFMSAVLHSAYAAAVAYLHGSLGPVLDPALASAAARSPLSGIDPGSVLEAVQGEAGRLYTEWEDRLMRALGISYAREAWWASGGSLDRDGLRALATPEAVGAWLVAKASIGRTGLPANPVPRREAVERLATFIGRGAAGLVSRIRREQERILGDKEYWALLREKGLA